MASELCTSLKGYFSFSKLRTLFFSKLVLPTGFLDLCLQSFHGMQWRMCSDLGGKGPEHGAEQTHGPRAPVPKPLIRAKIILNLGVNCLLALCPIVNCAGHHLPTYCQHVPLKKRVTRPLSAASCRRDPPSCPLTWAVRPYLYNTAGTLQSKNADQCLEHWRVRLQYLWDDRGWVLSNGPSSVCPLRFSVPSWLLLELLIQVRWRLSVCSAVPNSQR